MSQFVICIFLKLLFLFILINEKYSNFETTVLFGYMLPAHCGLKIS